MLTRKHFIEIAGLVYSTNESVEGRMGQAIVYAENFAKGNPRFDKQRFIDACVNGPTAKRRRR